MTRIAELINYLEEAMEDLTQRWVTQTKQINTTDTKKVLQEAITKTNLDSHMVITYLRSSAITESHQFKLAVYEKDPFIGTPIYQTMLNMKPLYTEVPNYMQTLLKQLSPPYFQIFPYEKEEIKRSFTAKLYHQSHHFFDHVLKEVKMNRKQRPIYFGEEMGELKTIGEIL